MEKQMIEEIKNSIRNTTSFRNEVKILRDNGYTIDETDLAQQKAAAYIKKRNGIKNIIDAKKKLDAEFELVKKAFVDYERIEYFKKKKLISPILKQFYDTIKELYDNCDFHIEYGNYFGIINMLAAEGSRYPFLKEIGHTDSTTETEKFLDSLIAQVRKEVCYSDMFKEYFFYYKCMECQRSINKKLEGNENVSNVPFDTQKDFGFPIYQHAINLVKVGDRRFILDPSYIQFCDIQETMDVIGVPGRGGARPGHYLMNTPEQIKLLHTLVTKGYFEVTEENLKMYMESFVLSNRNSEFYKNNPDISPTETEFDYKDYIALLLGKKRLNIGKYDEIGPFKGDGFIKNKTSR
ncbi:MAG: hypothetical protein E7310_05480 [Clostridiales bacterium]|nr:hypothetical protein [Clostridiales bacterium]